MSQSSLQKYLKIYFLLFLTVTVVNATGFGSLPYEIPEDERSAVMELEEGTLDSATWELLKPFYTQPLSVPLGELRYLRDIFPDLPDDLPVRDEVLLFYEPWTVAAIDVFFKDYPYLVGFKPIVSFATEKMPSVAHVAFFSRLSGYSDQFRQSVRFTVTPVKEARADGTVYFEENYARWQRRRILLKIPHVGKIQAGNFSFIMNKGLFYGYFPSSDQSGNEVKYNWMYGESLTWNGFSSETPLGKKWNVSSLVHIRETESIAGLKADFNPVPLLSVYGALSGASSQLDSIINDTLLAVHGGVEVSTDLLHIEIESGTNLFNTGSVPVFLTLSNGRKKHRYEVSFINIPEKFSAPRSSLLHSFSRRLDIADDTKKNIIGIDFTYAGPVLNTLKQSFHASYIAMENNADLRTVWKFNGTWPFIYSFFYGLDIYDLAYNLKHRFKLSTDHVIGSHLVVSPMVSYDVRPYEYWRIMANCYTHFDVFSFMAVSPFISFYSNSNDNHDLAVGIKQRITFFAKTFGELNITVPVVSYNNKKYSFYAKTYFLF